MSVVRSANRSEHFLQARSRHAHSRRRANRESVCHGKRKVTGPYSSKELLSSVASPVKCPDDEIPSRPAPVLGEHTDQILLEIGMAEKDLQRLRAEGVI